MAVRLTYIKSNSHAPVDAPKAASWLASKRRRDAEAANHLSTVVGEKTKASPFSLEWNVPEATGSVISQPV
jgi:hypothetical protein